MRREKAAIAFLFATSSLVIGACASGSAMVTGAERTPISADQVQLYVEPPVDFEVIGIVNASSDAGWTDQGSMDHAVRELMKQAAKLGANGVLIVSAGKKTTGVVISPRTVYAIPVNAMTIQALAIFVGDHQAVTSD